jgi:hypothetical protein
MDLSEIGWEGVDEIHLPQDILQQSALVNTEINLLVLEKTRKFLTS